MQFILINYLAARPSHYAVQILNRSRSPSGSGMITHCTGWQRESICWVVITWNDKALALNVIKRGFQCKVTHCKIKRISNNSACQSCKEFTLLRSNQTTIHYEHIHTLIDRSGCFWGCFRSILFSFDFSFFLSHTDINLSLIFQILHTLAS